MRATLWQEQFETGPLIATILRDIFATAGISLQVVTTAEELLAVAAHVQRAGDHRLLIIDCSAGEPSDIARCAAVATQTSLDLLIIHPREEGFHEIEQAAGRSLTWLPAFSTVNLLLDKLHRLQSESAPAESTDQARPVLSARQREVAELAAAGLSNREIADRLHITEDTIKTHMRHVMRKLGVRSRRELVARYHGERQGEQGEDEDEG